MATTEANTTDLTRAEILWKSADTLRGQIDAAGQQLENRDRYTTDSFLHNLHPDLNADYILANPPLNISDWGEERLAGDKRWHCGAFQQSSDHRIFPAPHAGVLNGR